MSNKIKYLSQLVIFIFNKITLNIDLYHVTLNTLMNYLNTYFTNFIKSKNQFKRELKFLENYISLKGKYMESFNTTLVKDNVEMFTDDVFLCKFLSFGRFFFKNIYYIIDAKPSNSSSKKLMKDNKDSEDKVSLVENNKIKVKKIFSLFKRKSKVKPTLVWRQFLTISEYRNYLNKSNNLIKICKTNKTINLTNIKIPAQRDFSTRDISSKNEHHQHTSVKNKHDSLNEINFYFKTFFNSKLT